MKKKKLLATVLASALACGTLSGCGGAAQTSGSAGSSDTSGKTVKIYQLKVEINDALQKLAQEYEEEKGVKVEVTSVGGGAVLVKVNGKKEVLAINIKEEVVDPDDVEMLEDLVLSAVNEALKKADEETSNKMGKLTGGLNIPGMF